MISFQPIYKAYDERNKPAAPQRALTAMQQFCKRRKTSACVSAFDRISTCRKALEALDRQGWNRSYHQRQFHEQFTRACARIFYKTEPPGTFQRDHQRLLQSNGWHNLSQEILISTPRRCELWFDFNQSFLLLTFSCVQLEKRYVSHFNLFLNNAATNPQKQPSAYLQPPYCTAHHG